MFVLERRNQVRRSGGCHNRQRPLTDPFDEPQRCRFDRGEVRARRTAVIEYQDDRVIGNTNVEHFASDVPFLHDEIVLADVDDRFALGVVD